jgi:hypothetical protein
MLCTIMLNVVVYSIKLTVPILSVNKQCVAVLSVLI